MKDLDLAEQFKQMYQQRDPNGRGLSDVQQKILEVILESQETDGEYIDNDKKMMSDSEVDALLEEIMQIVNGSSE